MNLLTLLLLALAGWLVYRTVIKPTGSRNKIAEEIARRMTEQRSREKTGAARQEEQDAVNLQECPACGTYRDPSAGPCGNTDCPIRR